MQNVQEVTELIKLLATSSNEMSSDLWLHNSCEERNRSDAVLLKNSLIHICKTTGLKYEWRDISDRSVITFDLIDEALKIHIFYSENLTEEGM
jgi:hypothetical protein